MQKPNEKTDRWIEMMSNSNKEPKKVKKEQKDEDNFESKVTKKVTTGENKYRNFVIKEVKYQNGTGEFEYKIRLFQEKKALHIRKRVHGE